MNSINGVTIVLLLLWFIVLYYGNRTPCSCVSFVSMCKLTHVCLFFLSTSLQLLCGEPDADRSAGRATEPRA